MTNFFALGTFCETAYGFMLSTEFLFGNKLTPHSLSSSMKKTPCVKIWIYLPTVF